MNINDYKRTFSDVKLNMVRIENGCAIYARNMAMYAIEAKVKITQPLYLFLTISATSELLSEITLGTCNGTFTFSTDALLKALESEQ